MNKLQLVRFAAGGLFVLAAGVPAYAADFANCMQQTTDRPSAYGAQSISGHGRQVGGIWAEDQAWPDDGLATLRPALNRLEDRLDQANLDLHQAEIDAAGALLKAVNAEISLKDVNRVLNNVNMELRIAQAELKTLRALPLSQENDSDIADLDTEIAMLKITREGVQGDLAQAKKVLRKARSHAAEAETGIAFAESAVARAEKGKDQVLSKIARYEAESFDAMQGGKSAFEIVSGPEETTVQSCENGSARGLSQGVYKEDSGNNS